MHIFSGGTTPAGFDCSGFVYYVINRSGRRIGRAMSAQINTGTPVARADLRPGDIVFFNNGPNRRLGHNGIYIGGGDFIHSANPRRGVVIDTINNGYYHRYYYTARRVH